MAKPGRKKKNAYLEFLDGNPTKRPIEDFGIEVQGEPWVPEHLSEIARGCIECIKQSMPRRIYSALDSQLLAAFGAAWAAFVMASTEIGRPGFVPVASGRVSPWFNIQNGAIDKMCALSDRLGLDPKSRQSLKLPGARQQKSKFSGLVGATRDAPKTLSGSLNASQFPAARDKGDDSSFGNGSAIS
jgi:phage terminase small subunit